MAGLQETGGGKQNRLSDAEGPHGYSQSRNRRGGRRLAVRLRRAVLAPHQRRRAGGALQGIRAAARAHGRPDRKFRKTQGAGLQRRTPRPVGPRRAAPLPRRLYRTARAADSQPADAGPRSRKAVAQFRRLRPGA